MTVKQSSETNANTEKHVKKKKSEQNPTYELAELLKNWVGYTVVFKFLSF